MNPPAVPVMCGPDMHGGALALWLAEVRGRATIRFADQIAGSTVSISNLDDFHFLHCVVGPKQDRVAPQNQSLNRSAAPIALGKLSASKRISTQLAK
jgi:hypothetical protein